MNQSKNNPSTYLLPRFSNLILAQWIKPNPRMVLMFNLHNEDFLVNTENNSFASFPASLASGVFLLFFINQYFYSNPCDWRWLSSPVFQMLQPQDHHIKDQVCSTRPPYRDGKKLRAVKVYTIAQESKYLLVQNVPAIAGVMEQLIPYFNQYGTIVTYWKLDDYEKKEEFVETTLIKFLQIDQARLAKCKLDDMNFLGSILHICYAPECESVDDLREKLLERRTIVTRRNHLLKRKPPPSTTSQIRSQMRDIVQKSNLVSLALQEEIKPKKKRIQIWFSLLF